MREGEEEGHFRMTSTMPRPMPRPNTYLRLQQEAPILFRVTSVSSWQPDMTKVCRDEQLLHKAVTPMSVMDWGGEDTDRGLFTAC